MTGWHEGPLVGFDCETTGVNVTTDRIVTASLVDVPPPGDGRPVSHGWLIDPGIDIPAEATALHGITSEHARAAGTDPTVALFEATGRLALALTRGTPLVAFNVAFDLSILEAENRRHQLPTLVERLDGRPVAPIVDPFVIDKAMSRRKGKRRLGDVCGHYRVTLPGAHTSDADALAAVRLARVLADTYPQLVGMTAEQLHAAQVVWRLEQQDSLRDYFDRQGIAHDGCDPAWPVRQPVAVAS